MPDDVGLVAVASSEADELLLYTVEAPGVGCAISSLPPLTTSSPIFAEHIVQVRRRTAALAVLEPEAAKALMHARFLPLNQALQANLSSVQREIDRLPGLADDAAKACTAVLAAATADQDEVAATLDAFRRRVEANGLESLSCEDVFQVLHLVGVPVTVTKLKEEGIDGATLIDITEPEIEQCFNLTTLGTRRRLTRTIRQLSDKGGFPDAKAPSAGCRAWGVEQVQAWLAEDEMAGVEAKAAFAEQDIDGPALLELCRDDLAGLGIKTAGAKTKLMKRITMLRKKDGCEPFPVAADGAASGTTFSASEVLEAVLSENLELQSRLKDMRARAEKDDRRAPDALICPIFQTVMDDPVMTTAGHTYERAAIEAWLSDNSTDPMCRAEIPDTLFPNITVRRMVDEWKQQVEK